MAHRDRTSGGKGLDGGTGGGSSFSQGTSGSSTDTITREREENRQGGNRKRRQEGRDDPKFPPA